MNDEKRPVRCWSCGCKLPLDAAGALWHVWECSAIQRIRSMPRTSEKAVALRAIISGA